MRDYSLDNNMPEDARDSDNSSRIEELEKIVQDTNIEVSSKESKDIRKYKPIKSAKIDIAGNIQVKGADTEDTLEASMEFYKAEAKIMSAKHISERKEKQAEVVQGLKPPQRILTQLKNQYRNFIDDLVFIKKSVGKEGKIVNIYKLRTMLPGTDKMFTELKETFGTDEKGNLNYDPRVTRSGKFNRKYFIDELPQIYNLLRGDLKIIGHRPMTKEQAEQYLYMKHFKDEQPGILSPSYLATGEKTLDAVMRRYHIDRIQSPKGTDAKYALLVVYAILTGTRSS